MVLDAVYDVCGGQREVREVIEVREVREVGEVREANKDLVCYTTVTGTLP